jgi:Cof subfamily protein (haloacid dehalogenase superfamily)
LAGRSLSMRKELRVAADPKDIKVAFFDVDGTLFSFKEKGEPESTKRAVRALAANGIMPVLATGRAPYMLGSLDLKPFSVFITFNGALCYTHDEVLYSHPHDKRDVEIAVRQTEAGLYPCLFIEKDRCYISYKNDIVTNHEKRVDMFFEIGDPEQALDNDIYLFNSFFPPKDDHILTDATDNVELARWTDAFCDVIPKGGGKEPAVKRMLSMLGLSPEQAIAFGDGGNDEGMLRSVGLGVAMGNGMDSLKQIADIVTDDVDNDGIWNACVKLGLI